VNLNKGLESIVRPLVAETGREDTPHAVWGSSFLVGLKRRSFLITTRHGLRPECGLFPLCVRSLTGRLFKLIDVFYMPSEDYPEDHFDIAVVELDMRKLRSDLGRTPILPLDLGEQQWDRFSEVSPFKVLGFPQDHSFVDYDSGEVVEGLVTLEAEYVGPTTAKWIHQLRVATPPPLSTFSGFSGGPVFLIAREVGRPPIPILAGMALQGTVQSGIVRFVETARIVDMVRARTGNTRYQ